MNTIGERISPAYTVGQSFYSSANASEEKVKPVVSSAVKKLQESAVTAPLADGLKSDTVKTPVDDKREITPEEQQEINELKSRDAEVRQHERAHQAAGGQYTGGASFTYQMGPDGKRYAVGGEVSIDTSVIRGDPAATSRKMRTVVSAALAPADPSAQDMAVARAAQQTLMQAQAQLVKVRSDTVSAAFSGNDLNEDLNDNSRVAAKAPYEEVANKYLASHQLVKSPVDINKETGYTLGITGFLGNA